jgi:hypothetical protein
MTVSSADARPVHGVPNVTSTPARFISSSRKRIASTVGTWPSPR